MFQNTSIGLDVHARSIHAAILDQATGEYTSHQLPDVTDAGVIDFIHTHCDDPTKVRVVYEAGPTGYHLARALAAANIDCDVLATSKLLRPSGDKTKTDKRDAQFLARVAAMGEYTTVRIPTVAEEAARDLVRARDDIRKSLVSTRHQASKLLLRRGYVFEGKTTWGRAYWQWLRQIRAAGLDHAGPGTLAAFDDAYEAVHALEQRRDHLDALITEAATSSDFAPTVTRLSCLRGISTLTGFSLAVEIGDWTRFTPRSIGAYLGLTPAEHSSGQSRAQGPITRTGNTHARRLLVESAWLHASPYRVGARLRARWDAAPTAVAAHADAGNQRLHDRWVRMKVRKKKGTTITAAVARELAGWCRVVATMDA